MLYNIQLTVYKPEIIRIAFLTIQVLDNSSQAVSMSGNDDLLALLQLWNDYVVPVGQSSLDGELERLKLGELLGFWSVLVPRVLDNVLVVLVICLHWRRWGVERSSPDLHLLLAVFRSGLGLVHPGKTAIVTLVQTPGFVNWNTLLTALLQY